ncbi:far upstream element-binding protein 1-like [Chironomus tepperi]|uniref:far upstream element-binding protein 1-like n=1 Tax=Chironomus tepperi TaxID=113505 RepID=UPI00391F049D
MSNFSLGDNNAQSIAIQKARQIAAKLQLAAPNKRPNDDDDNEPRAKRFSSGSDSSMSPANLQQAQQAAAQLAARFSQPNYQQNVQPNLEAVERAKLLINKFVPQGQAGGSPNFENNQGGGGNGPARPGFGANSCTEMMIPGSKVGLIIGKGGLTIKQLQERTGAKMVIIQDGPNQEMEKLLKISGDPQKVDHAKQLVFELLQDKGNDQPNRNQNQRSMQDHGGAYFNAGRGGDGGGGGDQFEIVIPKVAVGVVIGKEGSMIKKIQSDTGCSMKILQTKGDEPGDRICTIQGTKQQVDEGKIMIEELIDSVLRRNSEGGGGRGGGGNNDWSNNRSGGSNFQSQHHQQNQSPSMGGVQVQQYEFSVPSNKCGIIIGRGGDTIKQINQQSGAHCEMDRNKSANQMDEKTFSIKGDQHQVEEAKRLIQDKINMDVDLQYVGTATMNQPAKNFNAQNPQSQWGAGGGGNQYNQGQAAQMPGPQGANPQAGQSDYSLHWIQYYRSMGMHQQADAIEAQMKAQAQAAPANPPQPQAPSAAPGGGQDSQGDYRREWAAYYRQIGQVAEAEAIERQMKSGAPGNGNPLSFQAPGGAGNMQQQPQQQYGQYGANYQQYQ